MSVFLKGYFLIFLLWSCTIVNASDSKGGFLLITKGHRLKKCFEETTVESAVHCIQQCLIKGSRCLSINYGTTSYAKGKCQLNERAAVGPSEADLIVDEDFDYYERDTVRQESQSCPASPPSKSCSDLYKKGVRADGIYSVNIDGKGAFDVRCDMGTDGGGWTIFQRRVDGSEDFFRNWTDYKNGFGNLNGEFWLGLDNIHRLSEAGQNVLRVDLKDFENETRYAKYNNFSISDEKDKYRLNVGSYSGNASDSLTRHNGMRFTAKDDDNDKWSGGSCATRYKGAWWYNNCHYSNLNGLYLRGAHTEFGQGVEWYHWRGAYYSLKKTELKVRPRHF